MSKKAILLLFLLILVSVICLFAQQFEKVTYVELLLNGTYSKPRTVEAVFFGYIQRHIIIERNFLTLYQCCRMIDVNTGNLSDWSEWELTDKQPINFGIRQYYDYYQNEYRLLPNLGEIRPVGNGRSYSLIMPDIPGGRSSPYWWGTDGKSCFGFYKVYFIP